jgi:hypothetical protein
VREQAERWVADCNNEIPRDSLDGLTPAEFRAQNDPGDLEFSVALNCGGSTHPGLPRIALIPHSSVDDEFAEFRAMARQVASE